MQHDKNTGPMEPQANALIEGLAIWTVQLGQLREWKDKLMRDQESRNIEEALFPCQTQQAEPPPLICPLDQPLSL